MFKHILRSVNMRRFATRRSGLLTLTFSFFCCGDVNAQGFLSQIARIGQQAVGLPSGVQYSSLNYGSSLNASGTIAFGAALAGNGVTSENNYGIWMGTPQNLRLVMRAGDQAPALPQGVRLAYAPNFGLSNNASQIVVNSYLMGDGVTSSNDSAIWIGQPDDLKLLVREGDHAPGTPEGVSFASVANSRWNTNPPGQSLIIAELIGPGVTSANDRGLWLADEDGLTLVARKGDQAPGMPAGVKFEFGTPLVTALDDTGRVAFLTDLIGPGVGPDNDNMIWITGANGLTLVAREGDQAPGAAAGEVYSMYLNSGFPVKHYLNSNGQIAFMDKLVGPNVTGGNDDAIWLGTPDDLTIRVREGQLAPGTSNRFIRLGNPILGASGAIAFSGYLDSYLEGNPLYGIWLSDEIGTRLIARQGQVAVDSGGLLYTGGFQMVINSSDQLVFSGALGTSVNSSTTNGIWIDNGGQRSRIVGGGDIIDGQTVEFARFRSGWLGNGVNTPFNDIGQLLIDMQFVGGETALYLYSPELVGDFTGDGIVDAADYVQWRKGLGTPYTQADYEIWRSHFGTTAPGAGAVVRSPMEGVPEPSSSCILMMTILINCLFPNRIWTSNRQPEIG